jgi:acyl CoA:acetate/3-ketoacid CoA transferase
LTNDGLILEEIAPGIDMEKDVISKMNFKPLIACPVKVMDERLFKEGRIGMRDEIMSIMKK